MDGDPRLNCRVRRASELPLGVVPHLQGEDLSRQALALQVHDRIQQVGYILRVLLGR